MLFGNVTTLSTIADTPIYICLKQKFFFVVTIHTTNFDDMKYQVSNSNSLAVTKLYANVPFFSVRLLSVNGIFVLTD